MPRKTGRKTGGNEGAETGGRTRLKRPTNPDPLTLSSDSEILPEESPLLFPEYGPEDRVEVKRLNEKEARFSLVCMMLPGETTAARVQETCGGGRYRLTLQGPDPETAKMTYKERRQFDIEGAPTPYRPPSAVAASGASGQVTASGTIAAMGNPDGKRVSLDDIMSAGILNLFQAQQQVSQAMVQAVKEVRGGGSDWGETLKLALPLLTAIIEGRQAQPVVDPVALMEKFSSIMKNTAQPGASFKDVLETLNEALDLKRELRADHDGSTGDPMLDIVKENLPNLISVIQQAQRSAGQPVSSSEAIARRLAGTPAVTAGEKKPAALPAGETANMNPSLLAFLMGRRKLWAQHAEKGKDPAIVATYEWEMLPEQYRGPVREFMEQDDASGVLVKALPEVQKYPTWYDQFFTALHMAIFPERYEDGDDTPEDDGSDIVEPHVVEGDADDRGDDTAP